MKLHVIQNCLHLYKIVHKVELYPQ